MKTKQILLIGGIIAAYFLLTNKLMSAIISGAFQKAKDLLRKLEGLTIDKDGKCTAFWDVNGYAIGYGNHYYINGEPVKKGDRVSKLYAENLLDHYTNEFQKVVEKYVKVPLTDNQKVALISFTYNEGEDNLKRSSLLRLLNQGTAKSIVALEFSKWVYSDGKIVDGLIKRRATEKALFLS